MQPTRFERISKALAGSPMSRGRALATSAAGEHSAARSSAAQNVTPTPDAERGPAMLFVQTYQSGTITPKEGSEGRYTLTLDTGTGQTVYFSDRPDRIVGAQPTAQFLEGIGFSADNPPNAALVMETSGGETDVAVIELFDPQLDPLSQSVSFDVGVLANWQHELEMELQEAPTDLAALAPSFGAARLFIDDCPDFEMRCTDSSCEIFGGDAYSGGIPSYSGDCDTRGFISNEEHDGFCYSWGGAACLPCAPWFSARTDAKIYWNGVCTERYSDRCPDGCKVDSVCSNGLTGINC
jgi:hypothetical protein